MKIFNYILISFLLITTVIQAKAECKIPNHLKSIIKDISLKSLRYRNNDVRRHFHRLKDLCVQEVSFRERRYKWRMLLVTHPYSPKGAFWFLPHDDENSAFDSAIYATRKYGGGFLAVMAGDRRYFMGQDPNRNFGDNWRTARSCRNQKYPAPKYSKNIFAIINSFRRANMPYFALHNNKNGWYRNGGSGGVSILNSSKSVQSYKAYSHITKYSTGLRDEDSLIYIAGSSSKPNRRKLQALLNLGMSSKYEVINRAKNDCSMSNYVILNKNTDRYYNIETQHGDSKTQKKMIDKIMTIF